jgi:hypothetical protein
MLKEKFCQRSFDPRKDITKILAGIHIRILTRRVARILAGIVRRILARIVTRILATIITEILGIFIRMITRILAVKQKDCFTKGLEIPALLRLM